MTTSPAGAAGQQPGSADGTGEWTSLFDGRTTAGWRGFRRGDMPPGWQVVDGALTLVRPGAGDIITTAQFENFELRLQWKVAAAGNSGIFYRASEETELIYQGAPEMQVLDDAGHPDGQSRLTSAGSLYGLRAVPAGIVRPAGEWNEARVVARGPRVEHWLNGVRVVDYEIGTDEWRRLVAGTKFAEWPAFATFRRGHIGLQDHDDRVAYREIMIRELPAGGWE